MSKSYYDSTLCYGQSQFFMLKIEMGHIYQFASCEITWGPIFTAQPIDVSGSNIIPMIKSFSDVRLCRPVQIHITSDCWWSIGPSISLVHDQKISPWVLVISPLFLVGRSHTHLYDSHITYLYQWKPMIFLNAHDCWIPHSDPYSSIVDREISSHPSILPFLWL